MGKRLALIVGNSVYRDQTLARLKAPDVDVGSLHDILKDADVGGFDDVDLLVNSKSATVRRAVSEFFSRKSRDDLLLLYFSGHGVLDDRGRLHLAVKDTDHSLLRGTAISASFIADEMDNSRSQRQVIILDCCHSGAFARGTKGSAGITVGTASAFEGTGFGRVVLTATDATQYAWEGEQIIGEAESSLFTHYLVRGLQSGEADIDGDGKITIDELYDYVYAQVVQQTPKQTPGKWSFKEQGEIVIARASRPEGPPLIVEAEPFIDAELNQKLEQLYTKGLSAYWLEEWEQAAYNFQLILEINPDYQDATEKFGEVRRQLKLKNLYEHALAEFEAQKYPEAIAALEALVAEAPEYKDAASILQSGRKKGEVAELYAQAKQLYQAAQWQAVINIFDRIAELAPDYGDPEEMLSTAKYEFECQQRLAELKKRYQRALGAMNSGKWQEARNGFARIQEEEPGFEDTARLLTRVESEIIEQERRRQAQEQVGTLYEQATSLFRARQWRQALDKMKEIEILDPEFTDLERIATRAKAEIGREEEETQRQKELASLYAEAVRLLRAGEYEEALEKWGEVREIKPDYFDRHRVQRTARKRLAAQTKQGISKRQLSTRNVVVLGLLGLAIAIISILLGPLRGGFFVSEPTVVETGVANLANTTPAQEPTIVETEVATFIDTTPTLGRNVVETEVTDFANLSYTYERTFGETGVAYFADTDHIYNPDGVGLDSAGNLWVVEGEGARALKYTTDGTFLMSIGTAGSTWIADKTHFVSPRDITVDSAGNIWVTDMGSSRVIKFDPAGNHLKQLGVTWEGGWDNAHFNGPVGVAFDSDGNIYVSDYYNHCVQVFDRDGVYSTTIGVRGIDGSDNSHFNNPNHITIDSSDNLYVVDERNHRVQIFDRSHNYSATLGVSEVEGFDNDHFSYPRGVAVDTNYIYVSEGNHRVQIFDRATRAYQATLGTGGGSGDYQFEWPTDIAVDSLGNLYVADVLNSRVQKFDSSLTLVHTFGVTDVPYLTDEYHYNQPADVAVDADGNIAIIEGWGRGHRLIKLDASGVLSFIIGEAGVEGSDNQHFADPLGVAFDSSGRIYVADCRNHRVQIFNSVGVWEASLGSGFGTGNYRFNCPSGVAFDSSGNIYVADADKHRVQIFDRKRNYIATLGITGEVGSDNSHFNWPNDVEVDASGNIYVADTLNHRVQVFNSSWDWQKSLGVSGVCGHDSSHFCEPWGVAVDPAGNLYVAEKFNPRVQIFDSSGAYLTTLGGEFGSQNGQFIELYGVDVDAEGNVYIADTLNHRVEKYAPSK
jgi:tripartite motif-containing protein 71